MKKLILAVMGLALLASCGQSELEKKKEQLAADKAQLKKLTGEIETLEKEIAKLDTSFKVEQKAKLIEITDLAPQDFKHYIEVQGSVDAEENVTVLPQQPGIVKAIYVKGGQHVNKGQIMGITETTQTMEVGLQTLQTQLDLATTAYEKQKALWDQNIGSEIQYLQAKTQKETLEKQMALQKSQVEMTKLIAPISGTVDAVNLKVGDMAIGSQLMPGIRIVNNNSLSVKAKLSDNDFGKVKEGDKVELEVGDNQKPIIANVSYVQKTIDARSRTFTVEVDLSNAGNALAANMIARLKINDAIIKNAIVVPSNIVQTSVDGLYVLVATEENGQKIARKHMVQTGVEYKGQTVITDGLKEGDKIITSGYTEVVDGQKIQF